MTDELRLDEGGEDALQRWAFHDDPSGEQWAWVEGVLAQLATRVAYEQLGEVAYNRVKGPGAGDVSITCPHDRAVSVVVIPWTGDVETFSLRYVGDLDKL